jgi:hypothetical protein
MNCHGSVIFFLSSVVYNKGGIMARNELQYFIKV